MDLITKTFQVPQKSAQAGDYVDILFNIENVTDDLIEGVGVKFYLSRNSWISTGDYEIGFLNIPSIASNAQSGVNRVNLQLPQEFDEFWLDDENATYFIGALIDNNNAIDLGSSAAYRQFITHDAIDIKELFIPDLTGNHFSVSSFHQQPDGSITTDINFSILNKGDGYANNFVVDFYLSDETDISQHPITPEDYYLGSYEVGGLGSGDSTGALGVSFNLPNAFDEYWQGSGYYTLGMRINDSGATHESRGVDNNSNQGERIDYSINEIANQYWADLEGNFFDVHQEDISTYRPGQNLTIDYSVRNSGLGYLSQDFNLHFYVSSDPNIDRNDIFIGSQRFTDNLGSGHFGSGVADFILPENFPVLENNGTNRYYVGFIIDGDNEVFETNKNNNQNTGELWDYDGTGGAFDAAHAIPDLTNSSFNLISGDYRPGGTVTLEFSTANLSPTAANPFSVGIYLSNNEYISTNDFPIGFYNVNSGLTGYGDTGIIRQSVTLPDASHPFWNHKGNGTYFFGAIADPTNSHAERKESNNSNFGLKFDSDSHIVSGLTFTDLTGGYFSASPADGDHRLYPGESVNIDYQIVNQEGLNAGAFNVDFYLSRDPYISSNDSYIGTHQVNGVNGFSSTEILNGTFQLPDASNEIWSNFDGTYYLGMIIDGANQVVEISHTNNQNQGQYLDSDTVEVIGTNLPGGADLISGGLRIVDDVSAQNALRPGDVFDVEYSVVNSGDGKAPFFANNFYLATEEFLNSHSQITASDIDFNDLYGFLGDRDSFLIELEPHDYTGTQDITLRVPFNVSAGKYYLVMQTDDYNEVEETNEFNNLAFVDIYIDGAGDLFNQHLDILDDVSEDNPLQPGELFTAEYEVVNKGGENVPFSATHFYIFTEEYLNRNNEIQVEDIDQEELFVLYGDRFTEVITLEPGASTGKQEISLQIPENIEAGKYFLGIQSDVFDEVDEPNELNNSLFPPVGDYVEIYIGDGVDTF